MPTGRKPKGRPPKEMYNISHMVARTDEYTKKAAYPIIKELCLNEGWSYDYVMELKRGSDALSQSIKRLLDKKEIVLEKGGLSGKFNKTMVIFILKQPAHGWTDKREIDMKTEQVVIYDGVPEDG